MKSTATSCSIFALKSFSVAALLAATMHVAAASDGRAAPTTAEWQPPRLLGGLVLSELQPASTTVVFGFGKDFDGYGLAERSKAEDQPSPGVDPIKTAAIIPGVFGSVAIPMRNFPVAARWAKIYSAIDGCADPSACGENGASFAALATEARDKKFLDKLAAVNRGINTLIAYRKDEANYGDMDYWAKPTEILARGAGDCEDYVILKMAALIEAGVPAQSMSLVVLQDRSRGVFHAVLSVATQSGTFILDNLSNTVARDGAYRSYVPLYSFSTDRAWIHGAKPGSAQVASVGNNFAAIAPGEGPVPQ